MANVPKVAVSACLLGQKVRYNGDAAEFRTLSRKWSDHLELIPLCPEVGIGMGVPRPTIRLVKEDDKIKLVNPKNGEDFTEKMLQYSEIQSDLLSSSGVCGFVFKKDSPTCGVERVKVYRGDNPQAVRDGRGMFAMVFTTLNPHVPVIEEGRLSDSRQAEHFLARVHFFHEWLMMGQEGWSAHKVMQFHNENKLFLLSRAPSSKRKLGKLIADLFNKGSNPEFVALEYMTEAQKSLNTLTHKGRIAHTMESVVGQFSSRLTKDQKKEMADLISDFRVGHIPRFAPIVLINHYLRTFGIEKKIISRFLSSTPIEMGLMARI
jgi:uncharacterized protein YbbK (DUF523 family)/uncharacterized protein YbgA (DUF1722 family)